MSSMNTDPSIRPSSPLLGTATTGEAAVSEKGKRDYIIIRHERGWKVWEGVQAFFYTLLSLGIGLGFPTLRDKWKQAVTGKEKIFDYQFSPPNAGATDKASQVGMLLHPAYAKKKSQVEAFIHQARDDIAKISIDDLQKGLTDALDIGNTITNPEYKTTLWAVSEKVAQHYIDSGSFEKGLKIRLKTAKLLSTENSPLAALSVKLQNADPVLGVRLHSVDTSLFKNHTLAVQKRKYSDGGTRLHIEARLSHPARSELQKTLNELPSQLEILKKALPKGFCSNVEITEENNTYEGRKQLEDGKWEGEFSSGVGFTIHKTTTIIHFEGIGKVSIGNDSLCRSEYNRLTIDLDPKLSDEEAADKVNIMLAAIGLGAVSSSSRSEDTERIKIMQLFRAFYPSQAYEFERKGVTFDESVASLKTRIEEKVPEMKDKFQDYLEGMYQQEVYKGQPVWCVKGLSDAFKKAGGIGLMAGVTGGTPSESAERIASIFKLGALSTQDRFQVGIIKHGASPEADLVTGGGDSVFARMITKSLSKEIEKYPLAGFMQILYDPILIERVGYAYPEDLFGTKRSLVSGEGIEGFVENNPYQNRSDIVTLTENIDKEPDSHKGNEVCIHHRIGPEFIKGIRVNSELGKELLIKELIKAGIIKTENDPINGISIDQFIHVGGEVKEEYWA